MVRSSVPVRRFTGPDENRPILVLLRGSLAEQPNIEIELIALRYLLEDNKLFLELFDELIEHGEWGLALLVVCDLFREPDAPLLDEAAFTRIQGLQRAMEIDDESCRDLFRLCNAGS